MLPLKGNHCYSAIIRTSKHTCLRALLTHEEVQHGHVYEIHQPGAVVVWWCLLHCVTIGWHLLPPETTGVCVFIVSVCSHCFSPMASDGEMDA